MTNPFDNGGIIGKNNTTSTTSASGIWSLKRAYKEIALDNWPRVLPFANLTFTHSDFDSTTTAAFTYTGVDLGAVPSTGESRYIIVCFGDAAASTNQDMNANLRLGGAGGTLMSKEVSSAFATTDFRTAASINVLEANGDFGTSNSIYVTTGAFNMTGSSIAVYSLLCSDTYIANVTSTATDSNTTTPSLSLDTTDLSFLFATLVVRNGAVTPVTTCFGGTAGLTTADYGIDHNTDDNHYSKAVEYTTANSGITVTGLDTGVASGTNMCGLVLSLQ